MQTTYETQTKHIDHQPPAQMYCLSCLPNEQPTSYLGYCSPCKDSGRAYESVRWYRQPPENVSEKEWRNWGDLILEHRVLDCEDDPSLIDGLKEIKRKKSESTRRIALASAEHWA